MDAGAILAVYLGLFALHFAVEEVLLALNLRHAATCRKKPPEEALALMPAAEYDRSLQYAAARGRLGLASNAVRAALGLALILSGALGALQSLCERAGLGPELSGILLVYAVSLIFGLGGLPFSLWSQFRTEARFGFNRMNRRLFVLDLLKALGLSLAIGTPLLYLLFRLARWTPLWWLWAFLAASAVQLLLALLYPRLIAPLFNRFSALPEGPLREQVLALARRLGFRARGIYLMDGSRRSAHGNAYFTGLGRSKRIVLFDTLVHSLSPEQVTAVLAHEIGHEKKRHVPLRLAATLVSGFAAFWLLGKAVGYAPLFRAFGFAAAGVAPAAVLLLFFAGPLEVLFRPLASWVSRRQEHAADRFAYRDAGCGEDFAQALAVLSRSNLSNPTPHPAASFYFASHPTVLERIRALREPPRRELPAGGRGCATRREPSRGEG
jgi:STE24 endopeptidase